MTEGEKERLKLTANFLNILAAGTVVTGGVAPVIGSLFGSIDASYLSVGTGSVICVGIGILLHSVARSLLIRIDR